MRICNPLNWGCGFATRAGCKPALPVRAPLVAISALIALLRDSRLHCIIISAFALSSLAECHQYDASNAKPGAWHPSKEGPALAPLHASGNGWASTIHTVAVGKRAAVSFDAVTDPVISPLSFATLPTQEVSYVFAVVRSASLDYFLPTLIDAPGLDVRLRRKPLTQEWSFDAGMQGCKPASETNFAIRVNGVDTRRFIPAQGFQLAEISFESPVALHELRIGGAAPRPQWRRHWRGEIGEMIFLSEAPTPQQRNALYRYASRKWGVPVAYDVGGVNVAGTLREMGVDTGTLFANIIVIR